MKNSPVHPSVGTHKRSLSPPQPPAEIKQTKSKEELIRSFASSVNTQINPKQPTLHITIPSHLFSDTPIKTEG